MIDIALAHIAGQLDQALRRRFGAAEAMVVVSSLVDLDGSVSPQVGGKLVVLLAGIERETLAYRDNRQLQATDGRFVTGSAPAHLNLSVMCAANFASGTYAEALKLISATVAFFQARPVIDHANTPELDARIDKLTLEIENLGMPAMCNLWGVLGGKYLPSVLYKVRMSTIEAGDVTGQATLVRETAVGLRS